MKNKKKGVALLSAIVLMTVVFALTLLITTLVFSSSLTAQYQSAQLKSNAEILKLKNDFVQNGQASSSKYNVRVIQSVEDDNVKLMIVSNTNQIQYVCVYDFEQSKMLASQNQNFDIAVVSYNSSDCYQIANYKFIK